MKLWGSLLGVAGLLAVACGGGGESSSSDIFIEPEAAAAVAHAGLPAIEDLPGDGWEVTSQDQFNDTNGDTLQFLDYVEDEGACETLQNLATLQEFFGGDDAAQAPPAGRAQVEIQKTSAEALIPTSVEVQIEVEQTATELQDSWTLVKELFESEATSGCVVAVLNRSFADTGPAGGLDLEVKPLESSASAPQDGASMAFDVVMSIDDLELNMAMEIYFWPYGNAGVQALFLGPKQTVDAGLVGQTLQAIDSKLRAATEDEE